MAKEIKVNVTSIFQSGREITVQEYTDKWVELINLLEKNKDFSKES